MGKFLLLSLAISFIGATASAGDHTSASWKALGSDGRVRSTWPTHRRVNEPVSRAYSTRYPQPIYYFRGTDGRL